MGLAISSAEEYRSVLIVICNLKYMYIHTVYLSNEECRGYICKELLIMKV